MPVLIAHIWVKLIGLCENSNKYFISFTFPKGKYKWAAAVAYNAIQKSVTFFMFLFYFVGKKEDALCVLFMFEEIW